MTVMYYVYTNDMVCILGCQVWIACRKFNQHVHIVHVTTLDMNIKDIHSKGSDGIDMFERVTMLFYGTHVIHMEIIDIHRHTS